MPPYGDENEVASTKRRQQTSKQPQRKTPNPIAANANNTKRPGATPQLPTNAPTDTAIVPMPTSPTNPTNAWTGRVLAEELQRPRSWWERNWETIATRNPVSASVAVGVGTAMSGGRDAVQLIAAATLGTLPVPVPLSVPLPENVANSVEVPLPIKKP